jgi:hypothetical protein
MKLGMGGRFAALVSKLQNEGKSASQAGGIAAMAGRKKFGAKKMNQWAKAGHKRAALKG